MLKKYADLPAEVEASVARAIGCGIAVHRELGPGFKEKIYHTAYQLELEARGIRFESEKQIVVKYRQWEIPGQKVDLIIENVVLVELKAVPKLRELHGCQVRSYLRTAGLPIGVLMNFNEQLLKYGIKRVFPYSWWEKSN
jgi:GxxExxY protein